MKELNINVGNAKSDGDYVLSGFGARYVDNFRYFRNNSNNHNCIFCLDKWFKMSRNILWISLIHHRKRNMMKNKREIKQRIQELKDERDAHNIARSTRTRHNGIIRELEWVLDED